MCKDNHENVKIDLYILKAWLEAKDVNVKMQDHPLYSTAIEHGLVGMTQLAGPNQLIVSSEKGKISIIRGECSFGDYEIYSLEGKLFEDIERFADVKSAGSRIVELLVDP